MKKQTELQAPGIRDPAKAGYLVASIGFYRFPPNVPFYNDSQSNRDAWFAGYDGHPRWGGKLH